MTTKSFTSLKLKDKKTGQKIKDVVGAPDLPKDSESNHEKVKRNVTSIDDVDLANLQEVYDRKWTDFRKILFRGKGSLGQAEGAQRTWREMQKQFSVTYREANYWHGAASLFTADHRFEVEVILEFTSADLAEQSPAWGPGRSVYYVLKLSQDKSKPLLFFGGASTSFDFSSDGNTLPVELYGQSGWKTWFRAIEFTLPKVSGPRLSYLERPTSSSWKDANGFHWEPLSPREGEEMLKKWSILSNDYRDTVRVRVVPPITNEMIDLFSNAKRYYVQGDYQKCLDLLEVLHDQDIVYKDSVQMQAHCLQGADLNSKKWEYEF